MHEKEVIELIKSRDEGGVAQLLTHFGPLLRYVIAPILSNESDREECLSECAMRVWERIDRYDPERGSWTAWLTAIARNAALNRARKMRAESDTCELDSDTPSREPTPEEALLLAEQKIALQKAIAALKPGEKNLFYRKYYYLQPNAQIAAELATTERAVEGRLHRLRKKLRRELGGEGDG